MSSTVFCVFGLFGRNDLLKSVVISDICSIVVWQNTPWIRRKKMLESSILMREYKKMFEDVCVKNSA